MGYRRAISTVLAACVGLFTLVSAGGCEQDTPKAQTPKQVIEVAVGFVEQKRADRLTDLIYADSPEMRAMLNRLGELLGNLQKLADAIAKQWPDQVEAYRLRAESASADSRSLMFTLPSQPGETREQRDRRFQTLIAQVFADPYGFIERNADRLGTMRLTDDLASVTFDGMPVFPPVGIQLREVDGLWYVQLPSNLPPLSTYWPQTFEEWSIMASMVKVFDRVIVELTNDVHSGQVQRVEQLSEKAWEKMVFPAVLVWGAYAREMDVRRRVDTRMREYDRRERAWARSVREEQGPAHEPTRSLRSAMRQIAREEMTKRVRRNDRLRFNDDMSDEAFASLMTDWIRGAGLAINLREPINAEEANAATSAWNAAKEAEEQQRRSGGMRRRGA